ncbi:hypothetical protein ACFX10_034274 [Malus domestica]
MLYILYWLTTPSPGRSTTLNALHSFSLFTALPFAVLFIILHGLHDVEECGVGVDKVGESAAGRVRDTRQLCHIGTGGDAVAMLAFQGGG